MSFHRETGWSPSAQGHAKEGSILHAPGQVQAEGNQASEHHKLTRASLITRASAKAIVVRHWQGQGRARGAQANWYHRQAIQSPLERGYVRTWHCQEEGSPRQGVESQSTVCHRLREMNLDGWGSGRGASSRAPLCPWCWGNFQVALLRKQAEGGQCMWAFVLTWRGPGVHDPELASVDPATPSHRLEGKCQIMRGTARKTIGQTTRGLRPMGEDRDVPHHKWTSTILCAEQHVQIIPPVTQPPPLLFTNCLCW